MLLKFILKKLHRWVQRERQAAGRDSAASQKGADSGGAPEEAGAPCLGRSLDETLAYFKETLGEGDLKIHEFLLGDEGRFKGAILFIDGLVNSQLITEGIMSPLLLRADALNAQTDPRDAADYIAKAVLCSGEVEAAETPDELVTGILAGDTVLLLEGAGMGLIIGTKGWDKRAVSEPQSEQVIRGPREGFTENFRTNTALVRRRIKHPNLRMEHMKIGKKTATNLCLCYIKDIAHPEVLRQLRERLSTIDTDSILDAGYIEQYIEDAPLSLFSTVNYTEKPDVLAGKILEGRVGILVEGSPFALTVPFLFIESFQTAEDYYVRPFYASIARLMRFLAFAISLFALPVFIALTNFHQELIPTRLLFTIARAREGTPFPSFLEAIIMVYAFEVLREAGLRLPQPVGQAISIVGALIMGDAAVAAGLVGAPVVIVVALTAVAGFVVPSQVDSLAMLRTVLILLTATLGGFGLAVGFLGILLHLATLRSFGAPYFASVLPSSDQQDSFIRAPLPLMFRRPRNIAWADVFRRGMRVSRFLDPDDQEGKDQ